MQWTAEEIRRHRVLRGWSQQQLADAVGVHRRSVSSWENGPTRPQGTHADALDRVLGAAATADITLSQATEMQLIAELHRRLADRAAEQFELPDQDLKFPRRDRSETGNESHPGHTGDNGA